MNIKIQQIGTGKILTYAKEELTHFLKQYSPYQIVDSYTAAYEILLAYVPSPEAEYEYKISSRTTDTAKQITVAASTEKGVLSGVYRLLEHMGLHFGMNGPVLNGILNIHACDTLDEENTPLCRYRGIRQHINFPMDISSYHIEDAKEYVRNLARMGFNHITFHSYTGQWHGYELNGKTSYAGHFFYGCRHPIPDYEPIAKHIANQTYYCIPEIEGELQDEKKRDAFAVNWLNRVMETCHDVGMQISLSIELPGFQSSDLISYVRGVLDRYPHIDNLEWISPEDAAGADEPITLEGLEDHVRALFGDAPFENGTLRIPDYMPVVLGRAMRHLKNAVDLCKYRDEIFLGHENVHLCIGLYIMCATSLEFLKNIMVSVLPKDVLMTFLPAHGSVMVANNIGAMHFSEEELQRTLIYTWIEFDGNMYLQQNSSNGIQDLLEHVSSITEGRQIYGICCNHWRTAENEIVAGYAASAISRFEPTVSYYDTFAAKHGIADSDTFCSAMKALEDLDCFNRDNLFNIGFCFVGCWIAQNICWIQNWKSESIVQSMESYRQILKMLESCLAQTQTQAGLAYLRFTTNRIRCSIVHLQCILTLEEAAAIIGDTPREELTQEQKEQIETWCNQSLPYCDQYLRLHMEQLVDRGCEGTAVSYYATIPVYIDHIRQYYVYGETQCTH
ncbi:MAG: hypothetical protein J6S76_04635, partial [Clostridia bacterium]|nr:hypothetical protein [Clostridia bacterium]